MKIRYQDGTNGWARQEMSQILQSTAKNTGAGSAFVNAGIGLNVGKAIGGMMTDMTNSNNGISVPQSPLPSPQGNDIICPNCNTYIPQGMKFCGRCGSPVAKSKVTCSNCGYEIQEGMKFCGECGTPVVKPTPICSKCGAEVAEGMKFCGRCGNRME